MNQATDSCPIVAKERTRRQRDPAINDILMANHKDTVRQMAVILGKDPDKFTALEATPWADTVWARYFEQIYDMGPFDKPLIDKMMLLGRDYFNQTLTMNETTRRLYVTGVVSKAVNFFNQRIQQDRNPSTIENQILKFYYWSDHDDSIMEIANAFKNELADYPPFASQIIFELWRHGNISNGTESYHVLMKINDKNVTLLNECNGEYVCPIESFAQLAKNVSFYGDMEGYQKLCQNPFLSSPNPQSKVESSSSVKKE